MDGKSREKSEKKDSIVKQNCLVLFCMFMMYSKLLRMNKCALLIFLFFSFSLLQCHFDDDCVGDCSIVTKVISQRVEKDYIYNEDFSKVEKIIYNNNPDRYSEYNYDYRGNLVQSYSFYNYHVSFMYEFTYDDEDQLISAKKFESDEGGPYEELLTATFHYNTLNQIDSASYFNQGALVNGVKLYYNTNNPSLIDQTTNTFYDSITAEIRFTQINRYHYSKIKSPNVPKLSEQFDLEYYPQYYYPEFMPDSYEITYTGRQGDIYSIAYYFSFKTENDCLQSVIGSSGKVISSVKKFIYQ